MISRIALKELKENLREGRFQVMALTLLLLLVVAVFLSHAYYRSVNEQHREAREQARGIWLTQGDKNPHSAAHYGTYAFKPKYPLSLIDQGVDKYAGISIYLEAHKRNESQFQAAQDQTALARFGDLTPDFILLYILPLFIILTGYNALTREKESGTLRLVLSQGVRPTHLMLGKWLGGLLPLLALLGVVFGLAGLLLASLPDFGVFSWPAFLSLVGVYVVYYAVFLNLTLLVSALSRRCNIAFVVLLGLWMVSCLGMPKLATNLADALHPYPSLQEFTAQVEEEKERGIDGHNPWSEASRQFEQETLAAHGVDSVSQLPFNFAGLIMQQGEQHEAEVYFRHYQLLKDQYARQRRVYQATAALSPFLPARFLSMAISRTDYDFHWQFSDAAEKYRLDMVNALNTDLAQNSAYGDWDYKADARLWASVPDFAFTPPPTGRILAENLASVLLLLLWFGVSFGAMLWAGRSVQAR